MKDYPKTLKIDGVEYAPVGSVKAEKVDGMEYAIVRTYSAGVFAGYIRSEKGKEVELINARRLWYWSGAASLSQLSQEGVSTPDSCKFPCGVPSLRLKEVIEVIPATEEAKKSIDGVKIWTA